MEGSAAGTYPPRLLAPKITPHATAFSSPAGLDAAALELVAAAAGAGLPVGVHVRHGGHRVWPKGVAIQAAVAAGAGVGVLKPAWAFGEAASSSELGLSADG